MDTTIGYLGQVREDLLDAAFRSARRSRGRAPRRPLRLPSARVLVPVVTAFVLLVAGGLGWMVTSGPLGSLDREMRTSGGVTGATGATGERLRNVFEGATPAPAAADYAGDLAEHPSLVAGLQTGEQVAGGPASILGPSEHIIRTAEMRLVVPPDTFDERFAQAEDVAEAHGGFIRTSTGRERSGSLVMRVPSREFGAAMRDLREIGDVEVRTVSGQDVTAEYVDLNARLRIAEARRDVLLGLMAEATTIEQTIRVQNALDDTQLRIEELQGTLSLLNDRTSFATIRVELREEGVEPEAEVENPSVATAWDRAIAGFFAVISGVIVGLGYLLPLLVLGVAVWFVVRWVRRRRAA